MLLEKKEFNKCCICQSSDSIIISNGIDFEYETVKDNFTFHKCTKCKHLYLNPLPSPCSLKQIYPKNYGNYSNSQKFSLPFAVKSYLEFRFIKGLYKKGNKPTSVLDVGCGDGRLLNIIKSTVTKACNLEGVEISDHASFNARNNGYKVYTGSIESINLEPNTYDYIFMIQVIEHLHSPEKSIIKLREALKEGGILVIETPDIDCLDFKIFHKRYWGGYHYPRHFNLFNKQNLCELLRRNNFIILQSYNKLQPVHWIWSFHHILKEKVGENRFTSSLNIKNSFWIIFFSLIDFTQLFLLRMSSNQRIISQK